MEPFVLQTLHVEKNTACVLNAKRTEEKRILISGNLKYRAVLKSWGKGLSSYSSKLSLKTCDIFSQCDR